MEEYYQNSLAQEPVDGYPKPKKKRKGLLVFSVSLLVLVIVLAVVYFTVHIWTEESCTEAAQCRICGMVDGRAPGHDWEDADCTRAKTCEDCGKVKGEPLGHDWSAASCEEAAVCARCGETDASALGHDWQEASCDSSAVCRKCGITDGEALGHDWRDATCERAAWCARCGLETGEALPHQWLPATESTAAVCDGCGKTMGNKLSAQTVYLYELPWTDKYGKLWHHEDKAYSGGNSQFDDYSATGYLRRTVMDNQGNVYHYGMHLDGYGANPFYITYDLAGKYTTFSGTCVLPDTLKNTGDSKYFEIYCDGKLTFTSNTMCAGCEPQTFVIDVTGVRELRIEYPATSGSNETATLCDAWLQ